MADRNPTEFARRADVPGVAAAPSGYRPRTFTADPGLGLRWARPRNLSDRFAAHAHPELLIGLTRGGREDFVDDGKPGRSLPGMIRFLPPELEHEGGAPPGGRWSYDVLYVPPGLANELAGLPPDGGFPAIRSTLLADPLLAGAVDRLFAVLESDEPLAVAEQLSRVLRRVAEVHTAAGLPPVAAVRHRCLERVRELLHANVHNRVRLDSLSQEAGLSKFHLIRSFRQHTGLTPWQYQTCLRIELAKARLAGGSAPSRVAQELGFVDQSHFTRTFRSLVGTTPGVYADRR